MIQSCMMRTDATSRTILMEMPLTIGLTHQIQLAMIGPTPVIQRIPTTIQQLLTLEMVPTTTGPKMEPWMEATAGATQATQSTPIPPTQPSTMDTDLTMMTMDVICQETPMETPTVGITPWGTEPAMTTHGTTQWGMVTTGTIPTIIATTWETGTIGTTPMITL